MLLRVTQRRKRASASVEPKVSLGQGPKALLLASKRRAGLGSQRDNSKTADYLRPSHAGIGVKLL